MMRWQRGRGTSDVPWGSACAARRDFAMIASLDATLGGVSDPFVVADRTWRDLSLDDVFAKLDRCVSMVGQQTLYRRLRRPSDSAADVARFDRKIRAFGDDPRLRAQFQEAVRRVEGDAAPLLYGEPPPLPRAAALFPFATCVTFLAAAVSVVWPLALLVFIGLVIGNIAIRLHLHHVMTMHAEALSTIARLVASADRVGSIESAALRADLENLRAALAVVAPWRRSLTWATLESPNLNEVLGSVVTYLNCFFLLDVNAYVASLTLLRQGTPALRRIFETVGELDVARSIASFRAGTRTWSVPAIGRRGGPIVLTSMRHPLIDEASAVPNDVSLTNHGWLVLGSNMSGKSTCLKAIALQAVLAQSVATTTCEGYAAPPLGVRTLIHVEDDLAAVLRGLHRRGAFVVAATHDGELMDLLEAELDPHYFTERIEDGCLHFDYVLHAGRAAPRNAIALLALVGCPEDVLADARVYLPSA
ncbi:MAG: hypothetical protein U0270_38080 [Labilithrix sp.]